ncbi:MAG: hypothetical protein CL916_06440 [Deltaproteobacteria bacterium]|nr:hypothetical protein [Deltaproteobacteria bacterium]
MDAKVSANRLFGISSCKGSMIFFVFFACRSSKVSVEDTSVDVIEDSSSIEQPESSSELVDIDEDGFLEGDDCDDWDPDINPNAVEIFDYIDNNCDGIIDYDGTFSGSISMVATAIYEGVPYSFSQTCSGSLERERGATNAQIVCTIDMSQENADILLGNEVTVAVESTTLHDSSWQEDWMVTSSDGWDTPMAVEIQWSELQVDLGEKIHIEGDLDSFSLDMSVEGDLYRE